MRSDRHPQAILLPLRYRLHRAFCMVIAVAAVVAAAIPFASAQNAASPVFIAQVIQEQIVDQLEALGTLRANESISVTSQVTEIVTKLNFEDGQRVKAGDVLAEMTSAEERAQLKEAEATVREAKLQWERIKPLAKKGVSSEALLSEARRDLDTAGARLEAVNSRIADRMIAAPFGGIVGLRRMSVGALVEPGTVITTVDDDSVMKLDFSIPATFLPSVRVGLPVEAKSEAFGARVFAGRVASIDSRVDPITRSITVRAIIPNKDSILRSGALMTINVLRNERQALVIPEQAVISRGRKSEVFVVDPTSDAPKVRKQEVKLGTRRDGKVEVTDGIAVGDYVVTEGGLRISDGSLVKIAAVDGNASEDIPLVELLKQKPKNPS